MELMTNRRPTPIEKDLTEIKESIKTLSASFQTKPRMREIPPQFEKIGRRFFYIERESRQNWFAASNTCRKMGGHLATIQDQEEMDAIAPKIRDSIYWVDITDLAKEGEHVSSLTGRRPPFYNWKKGEPAPINEHCVNFYTAEMCDARCNAEFFFICQYI
ncbi:accessory gland protein Acp29AB-like [Drosophila takahashii]|uniref:accessory gland protein Acp29AB-like n=1 Tax=Drosophila takahashii TaxID=29030 RepID=UPI0038994413